MANDKLIYASEARKAILNADPKLAYCIDSVPAVDAVEVVHGRWEKRKIIDWVGTKICFRCTECKTHWDVNTNYCPNCGAKMDGGNEDG